MPICVKCQQLELARSERSVRKMVYYWAVDQLGRVFVGIRARQEFFERD